MGGSSISKFFGKDLADVLAAHLPYLLSRLPRKAKNEKLRSGLNSEIPSGSWTSAKRPQQVSESAGRSISSAKTVITCHQTSLPPLQSPCTTIAGSTHSSLNQSGSGSLFCRIEDPDPDSIYLSIFIGVIHYYDSMGTCETLFLNQL